MEKIPKLINVGPTFIPNYGVSSRNFKLGHVNLMAIPVVEFSRERYKIRKAFG
jgi:hypothetical protein